MRGVLSIQSEVVYGHVGNGAARFALQRMGLEVWAVPTVLYSNHPGHGAFTGEVIDAELIKSLVQGLDDRGQFAKCDAVISGYLRSVEQVHVVADIVRRVKDQSETAIYCCDPVMGDEDTGAYVPSDVVDAISSELVPLADIATPNAFELAEITSRSVSDVDKAFMAADCLDAKHVLATSIPSNQPNRIATVAKGPEGAWMTDADIVENAPHGLGDFMAALFLGHIIQGRDTSAALAQAAATLDSIIRVSTRNKSDELMIIREQNRIVTPDQLYPIKLEN